MWPTDDVWFRPCPYGKNCPLCHPEKYKWGTSKQADASRRKEIGRLK